MNTILKKTVAAIALSAAVVTAASAETRVTYKSAKTGSSYYQMGVELAEGSCQTNANQSLFFSNLNLSGCAEAAPLGKSSDAVQLEN